jgi:DNA repair protein RecN (Recombination protein N)
LLTFLRVRSFAIIDELEVELGGGLNAVTGETGAGKSILVDAIDLVLGGRGKPELVRTGAAQAEVEATFDVSGDAIVRERLLARGIETTEELIVRRVVSANGRTRAYVNGTLATQGELAELTAGLADVSSQHEHHSLTDPARHLGYLDAYGRLEGERSKMKAAFVVLDDASRALAEAREKARGREDREDVLRFQLKEIEALAPEAGELASLVAERDRLKHAEKLLSAARGAEDAIYGRDASISGELAQIGRPLGDAADIDARLRSPFDRIEAARAELEEAARDLAHYARGVSSDPERLSEIDERLHRLGRLARKHGEVGASDPIVGVLAFRDRARAELDALGSAEERIELLEKAQAAALDAATKCARSLSASRKKAAAKLGQAITKELGSLGMGGAEVRVDVAALEARGERSVDGAGLTATGMDRCELLIAPNVGEDARPLRKIASGGELSRALLAIKRVLAGLREAEGRASGLYVFDEVDTGVGGAVAEVIGKKLKEVAQHHQVLVITHLAPIAVYADRHFQVKKQIEDGRTRSTIEVLGAADRLEEVARMLGGLSITKKTREAAREMLKGAHLAPRGTPAGGAETAGN